MNAVGPADEWLVVLPDHPESHSIAATLDAPRRVDHPSGRPWLVGRWDPVDLRVGTAGRTSVAALGFCSATPERLTALAARTEHASALDGFTAPGCFHLLASVRGTVRAQGTLSGLRRVVHADVGGLTVAATRADVLARLTSADLDRRRLVLKLLLSEVPLHTVNAPLWEGVRAVDEDCCLVLSPAGRGRSRRRWEPPPADLPLAEAAGALRVALADAVRARQDSGLTVTADLSGGLDSTTLCFLASRGGRPLTTVTRLGADLGDDDPLWADLAAGYLPNLRRLTVPRDRLPSHYSDVLDRLPATEEPFPGVEDRPMYRTLARLVGDQGSQVHLTGDGGDETLMGGASGVFELLRRHPLTAWRHLRAYRALEHLRWRDILGHALDRREDYPGWLARRARALEASPLDRETAATLVQLPPWATPEAVELARDLLLEEAATTRRHGRDWTAHHTVWGIRTGASLVRATVPLYAAEGTRITSPYLDDAVVQACTSARTHERRTPWKYKPLLAEAMRGIVPEPCLARSTKAEGSNVEHDGLRANVRQLAELCADSRLGRLGLVDPGVLRETCTSFRIRMFTPYAISTSVSCERWLRDLEQPAAVDAATPEVVR
ncbi:asparagine synthase-related protein [Actinosynnema sp. NPDC050436]|uniref:asparagine synthase-related protein n=1 Tax=Actinosynnema sp. NPDC050436 TaxID=3155659 RepID=UPI0033CE90F0